MMIPQGDRVTVFIIPTALKRRDDSLQRRLLLKTRGKEDKEIQLTFDNNYEYRTIEMSSVLQT